MTEWAGSRKKPWGDAAPAAPTLPPIESIDADAAYRVRVGLLSRGILFLFRYFPLTLAYLLFEALHLVTSVAEMMPFFGLGMAGDLLRWRYAPDLRLTNADWVGIYCDGEWSENARQLYARWYCGLEVPLYFLGLAYLLFLPSLARIFPAHSFDTYLNLFSPLQEWVGANLFIAGEHRADLIAKGSTQQVDFLLHYEMFAVFVTLLIFFLICIGGNTVFKIVYKESFSLNKKNKYKFINKTRKSCEKFILIKIIWAIILTIIICIALFIVESRFWNRCLENISCFENKHYILFFYFVFTGSVQALLLSSLLFRSMMLKAWSIRSAQLSTGEGNNAGGQHK